jgi:dCTP deaminase
MSLLSHNELLLLLQDGVITNSKPELVNAASIDIQLGRKILIERNRPEDYLNNSLRRISLRKREQLTMIEHDLKDRGPFIMYPGEFILAHSIEMFNLPNNISAEYKLKSSMARIGLEHLNAGWCDAGWYGSVLTLELKNLTRHHEIELNYGDLIGQMVFYLHQDVPMQASYATRGRYNNDTSVSGAKYSSRTIIYGDALEETYQDEYDKDHPPVEVTFELPRKILSLDGD